MYDSIIIGSGPAGITASLYMVRAGLKVLIISKNESALHKAEHVENYYGFEIICKGRPCVCPCNNYAMVLMISLCALFKVSAV